MKRREEAQRLIFTGQTTFIIPPDAQRNRPEKRYSTQVASKKTNSFSIIYVYICGKSTSPGGLHQINSGFETSVSVSKADEYQSV